MKLAFNIEFNEVVINSINIQGGKCISIQSGIKRSNFYLKKWNRSKR